ncbi:MAG: fructosamine kinase family protein [Spirochaetota bacterium]
MSRRPVTDAASVEDALRRIAGESASVASERPVGGGCIADGRRVTLTDGRSFFVKQSDSLPPGIFASEARGLEALASERGPRVPRVEAYSAADSGGFIVLEWIEPGEQGPGFAESFGRRLAALHAERRVERFGFDQDNYIGSTPQPNGWMDSWHDFFRERRIGFQTRLARERGLLDERDTRAIDAVLARLETLLPAPGHPSVLHGDLWGGNYLVDAGGRAVLIDPATYYGHREADLAMTELFGGFPARFYRAYEEASPLQEGYRERVSLYNLYHLLNHANIFGGGYVSSVRSVVSRYR